MIFLGLPVEDHSIRPRWSRLSSSCGEYRQCFPDDGLIPRHSSPVGPLTVSPGACNGLVVYRLPLASTLL